MNKMKENPATKSKDEKSYYNITKELVLDMFEKKEKLKGIEEEQEESKAFDERTKTWKVNEKVLELFSDKIKTDIKLKGKYAIILIIILIIQLATLNVLFILKGKGALTFSDTTFNIFITAGIAEIFVLVNIIVKYIFNDDLADLLKIILRANNYKEKDKNLRGRKSKN